MYITIKQLHFHLFINMRWNCTTGFLFLIVDYCKWGSLLSFRLRHKSQSLPASSTQPCTVMTPNCPTWQRITAESCNIKSTHETTFCSRKQTMIILVKQTFFQSTYILSYLTVIFLTTLISDRFRQGLESESIKAVWRVWRAVPNPTLLVLTLSFWCSVLMLQI